MLPHFNNFEASVENNELVTDALFEVVFFPPDAIAADFDIVAQHVMNVQNAWDDKNTSEVVQVQVGHVRLNHASDDPGDNTITFTIDLSIFLNKEYSLYAYNKMRSWRRLVFDASTGIQGEKRNYVGSILVRKLSRNRNIVAQRLLKNCFPINNLPLFNLDITATDAKTISCEFVSDIHEDIYR